MKKQIFGFVRGGLLGLIVVLFLNRDLFTNTHTSTNNIIPTIIIHDWKAEYEQICREDQKGERVCNCGLSEISRFIDDKLAGVSGEKIYLNTEEELKALCP